jgi:hypothetical protein
MKRVIFILGCLMAVCPALFGDTRSDRGPGVKAVVVDPMDLRQPVPSPERELAEKYDGKTVRFTGTLQNVGQESKSKTYWYELAVDTARPKGKAAAKKDASEVVVVKVYFQTDEKRLRSLKTKPTLTVEGTASILSDGRMVISHAVLVDGKIGS